MPNNPGSAGRPLTLLHLSDPQFGKNHRFAQRDLSAWDTPFDTLLSRLKEDLRGLRESHGLVPDLLVMTGDLAEWGLRSEFEDALKFLRGLCEFLHLPPSRVAIIPGNHDINRPLCEAYFSQCKGLEMEPAFPYWPKWELYARFFNEFYGDTPGIQFTEEIPWSLFVIEDLKVAVAGLNSTMQESHRDDDHYGWVGERQLSWFREQLEQLRREGWLRIGAVHHNYRRGPTRDDENLRDADDLERVLGRSLNLLLHGHTHDGKLGWIHPGLPVLSTGSAALKSDQRPPEVPNQYQIIQVWANRFCRWTRGFAPDEKRWIGDNRASEDGSQWWEETPASFRDVQWIFLGGQDTADNTDEVESAQPDPFHKRDLEGRDDFLARVEMVCRLREPGAEVERLPGTGSFGDYLRVTRRSGGIAEMFPVGAVEYNCSRESLQTFLKEVDARYRRADPSVVSVLVYGDEPAAEGLRSEAEACRVHLQSFVEYQGLIDFRSYITKQTAKLVADPIYPPQLYVPQRMRTLSILGREEDESANALAQLRVWLDSPHGRFLVLLGDFGTGKTFLLHEVARRVGEDGGGLIPILLQMRSLEKGRSLDALLAQHFAQEGMEGFSPAKFRYMLEQGRIALLFDGFDELALRVTYARAAEHFSTLLQAATGSAKVVLTSRRQHFLSESQVKTALTERVESLAGHRLAILQPFDREQVRIFLVHFFSGDEQKAASRLDLIERVKDLLGLSANPRLLGFIADLPEEQLVAACAEGGEITAAKLYELLLERWLEFEFDRVHPQGAPPGLSVSERWHAVTLLAMRLWQKTDRFVSLSDLDEAAARVVQAVGPAAPDAEVAAFQVGSGTLLVRDDEGNFAFLHQSILEWLVAKSAAEALAKSENSDALTAREISPLMADFLVDLAGQEQAVAWAKSVLAAPAVESTKKNALLVLERQKQEIREKLDLTDQNLRGQDFSGHDLSGANLSGANLTEARLVGTRLAGARLVRTNLRNANLTSAVLAGADLTDADLTGAHLLGADLREARFTATHFRRTGLFGAALDAGSMDFADFSGAALELSELSPQSGAAGGLAVAWSPNGELLASASGSVIRLWEAQNGRVIRVFSGHQGTVLSVVFNPDGKTLASSSNDKTVRLWDVNSGHLLKAFAGHKGSISSVAFSPDGRTLASGSNDNTVRLWQIDSEHEVGAFHGHKRAVTSVAFSPDGESLASGSSDSTVRLWQVDSGREIWAVRGHGESILSLSFSPDGRFLASSSFDRTIRLWHTSNGRADRIFTGHREAVLSISFSPNGEILASAASDGVRLWHVDGGGNSLVFEGEAGGTSVAFNPDGRTVAICTPDRTVLLWRIDSARELRTLGGHDNGVASVAFSPDGKFLVSTFGEQGIRLWEVDSGREVLALDEFQSSNVAFSPHGYNFSSVGRDKIVRVWGLNNARIQRGSFLSGHQSWVMCVAYSPGGETLASGSDDRTVRLWDIEKGKSNHILRGHEGAVLSVAFNPNGETLASGSEDQSARVWQGLNGNDSRSLAGHQGPVWTVAFSPNGEVLATGSGDRTIRLWHVRRGREIRALSGHKGPVWSVAYSPNGETLASASYDHTVRLWQVNTGRELRAFIGHQGPVWSVTFSPDGRTLASGSADGIRLWNVADGRCLAVLLPLPEGWVAYSPDGRYKFGGIPAGGFWHAANLCRFEIGELDEWVPGLRLADDASFFDLPPWKPEIRVPERIAKAREGRRLDTKT